MPRESRYLYNLVVRDSDNKITDTPTDLTRTETVEFLRSLLRVMDEDEYTVQIDKRMKW
jgi:hypothetical protein